jgi:transposase-like protein
VAAPPDIDGLPEELKQLIVKLLAENAELKRANAELREEIACLKGLKGQPSIKPSGMDQGTTAKPREKRPGRSGRGKTTPRVRVEEQIVRAEVPPGSRFKGYEDFVVQDVVLQPRTIRYRRERWLTPDGRTVVAPLPPGIRRHFGPELRRLVLAQYHQGQVTVRRLVAAARDRDQHFEATGDAAAA